MAAVVGYLVAAGVTIAIVWIVAGRSPAVPREPAVDLAEIGSRHVSILGGFAGFAVTGMVLLVTLGRGLSDTSSDAYTTVLTMFFAAYVGFIGSSLLYANIPDGDPGQGFDVPAAMFAGASVLQFFTISVGWYALVALFVTVGLDRLAGLTFWLLLASTVASYGLVATQLRRSGLFAPRLIVLIPALTVVAVLVAAALSAALGLHSADSVLALTVTAFVLGSPAFGILSALPALVREDHDMPPLIARYGTRLLVGFAQAGILFVGFLVLAVLKVL